MTDLGRYVWKRERVRVSSPAGLPVPLRHPKADPRGAEFGGWGGKTSFFGSSFFSSGSREGQIYIFSPSGGGGGGSAQAGLRRSLLAGQRRSDLVLQLIPPAPVPEMQLQSRGGGAVFYATNNSR